MILAIILIYLFSLLGFLFFRDDFVSKIQQRNFPISSYRSWHERHSPLKNKVPTCRWSSCCSFRHFFRFGCVYSCSNIDRWISLFSSIHRFSKNRTEFLYKRQLQQSNEYRVFTSQSTGRSKQWRRSRTCMWHIVHVYCHNAQQRITQWWWHRRCPSPAVKSGSFINKNRSNLTRQSFSGFFFFYAGTFIFFSSYLWYDVLLHCYYHYFKSYFWCNHR